MSMEFDEKQTTKITTDQGNTINLSTIGARYCDICD